MNLSTSQRRIVENVVNAFETGTAEGDYSNISVYADGPHGIRQITFGKSQTTEYGNLRELVVLYVAARGTFSEQLAPYVDKIGSDPDLVDDSAFKKLLRDAGKTDPKMRETQDKFFDKRYFKPAMKWADDNGFTEALSALVIYDSFIHSGSIPWVVRNMFSGSPPAAGGSERDWITGYVNARHSWLANHSRAILHGTVYRTKCFKREIARANWDLSQTPVDANGVKIS